MTHRAVRVLVAALAISPWGRLHPAEAPAAATPDPAVLKRYCAGCHNEKVKSGSFSLNPQGLDSAAHDPAAWEKVVKKLRTRSMPPVGLPRPDEATYRALVAKLEGQLDKVPVNPGRTDTFRRLNRTEYQNAVRDLLHIDLDVRSLLPSDESSHGFDNITVGDLSPTLLERYLTAARKISRLAIGSPLKAPGGDTLVQLPPDLTQEDHFENLPLGTRGGAAIKYTFPLDAKYDFQIRLARDRNEHVEGLRMPSQVELLLDGERVRLFTVKPPPPGMDHSDVDRHLNIRVPVKAGPHVVAVTFPKTALPLLETERQPWHAHFNMDRHPRIQPALYSLNVNGPYEPQGPGDTPSRRRIVICQPANAADEEPCAKRIFAALTKRAYRRPVADADLAVPMKFFREARTEGFDAGIEMGLRSILVNPEFLFRVEQDPAAAKPGTAYRVSDLELATRLSFFLWSSIPDDELLDTAIKGKLKSPAVLEAQVKRMLADPRSSALVTNFAEQWLYLRNLSSSTPDMRLFTDFDDNLRRSFRKETELFFESILREDRSILDLLRANYTFVNERLAKHYGIPNIYGSRFRKVTFDEKDSVRGGLLRQGSVLTVTSYATRTSPVIRGKWVLDNILGIPPPPPPPDVPALKEKAGAAKAMSMRERLAQHRANPACSGCHNIMDPVGFAFENYDAVGRWRRTEEDLAIDPSGSLPDGTKFAGVAGLQQALLKRPELFATTFTEKLLTYGVGRGVEYYDAPAIRKVVRDASANEFRFSSFISGIVNSAPFQMRRSQ